MLMTLFCFVVGRPLLGLRKDLMDILILLDHGSMIIAFHEYSKD